MTHPSLTPLKVGSSNVNSIKTRKRRSLAYNAFKDLDFDILFLQETRLSSLREISSVSAEWTSGASFWSYGPDMGDGVGFLFKGYDFQCEKVIDLSPGRCLILDVSFQNVKHRLINVYGYQTKKQRRDLFGLVKPFLFTSKCLVLGGDFNCVTSNLDRGSGREVLEYDIVFLNDMCKQANLSDVYRFHNPNTPGYTYVCGERKTRIDRLYVRSNVNTASCRLSPVEYSDHVTGGDCKRRFPTVLQGLCIHTSSVSQYSALVGGH
ncbi:hypothetical protein FKM82_027194 [Ascaphus truei]